MQWYCQLLQSVQKVELSFTSFNAWRNKTKILRDNPCHTVQFSRILFHSSIVRQVAQKIVQCNRAFSFTNLDTCKFGITVINCHKIARKIAGGVIHCAMVLPIAAIRSKSRAEFYFVQHLAQHNKNFARQPMSHCAILQDLVSQQHCVTSCSENRAV